MSDRSANDQHRLDALERSLTNQAPAPATIELIESVRSTAKELGRDIIDLCPDTRERSLALTHLEETVMWAVKSLVLYQP